ncbi:EF-P beta-lysylation protein EpmB [Enterovibrio norvegicus]|uniref:L-lysine 2,3-aminomutase n=1 Tax=Enterovibrio norvegicus TaxID=188144 RepID=A0ABV4L8I5_9GAMM|nr:EF-P beta-lysylation protein EpmB [Enterovibrio norvegicus]OEF54489.1 EF-P beta-lysylation protein EpmB [Enterovibrio norvegicus]OEF63138.1 EF-P beta-lysylation protein EpmB [Enterovibrio norvegicus]
MPDIITRNASPVEQNWIKEIANAVSNPQILLQQLDIEPTPWMSGFSARALFSQRVPQSFIARMEKGNPNDPLLRQVLPVVEEFDEAEGFTTDPLEEQDNDVPGLLHKYKNRVLMIVKGGCAINCRYCFRRHFPYQDNKGSKDTWRETIAYLRDHPEVDEVILSGGDPLMAKDHELKWLVEAIEAVPHIRKLRIHTRLPVVIPSRITPALAQLLKETRLKVILVTHINHANEINDELRHSMAILRQANVTLLNQGVLLKGVNDSVDSLKNLSNTLFDSGILPYYLHVLDKVKGAAHFLVSDDEARSLMTGLIKEVSGYLVPKLTREVGGKASKTPLDLHLE